MATMLSREAPKRPTNEMKTSGSERKAIRVSSDARPSAARPAA
jgi:hypothetical protein